MKRILLLAGAIFSIAQLSSAAPACTGGTLASYVALGTAGCTVGLSTFDSFATLNGTAGATAILPQNVTITPSGTATNPMLQYQVTGSSSTNPLEAIFTYQLMSAYSFTNSNTSLSNTSQMGTGTAAYAQNQCLGGTFGPNGVSGCSSGLAQSMAIVNSGTDALMTAPATLISVTDDLILDPGSSGTVSGATFSDQFAVPEPATLSLAGLALVSLAVRRRKAVQSNRRSDEIL